LKEKDLTSLLPFFYPKQRRELPFSGGAGPAILFFSSGSLIIPFRRQLRLIPIPRLLTDEAGCLSSLSQLSFNGPTLPCRRKERIPFLPQEKEKEMKEEKGMRKELNGIRKDPHPPLFSCFPARS